MPRVDIGLLPRVEISFHHLTGVFENQIDLYQPYPDARGLALIKSCHSVSLNSSLPW